MPTGSLGFELSTSWHSTGEGTLKIRALRDCCDGWGSYYDIWSSANHGSGSGLDADLLDGQHGSYYATASHTHDDRYLVKGGSWNGSNMPGSRWGGFSVNGGEVVFQRDNPSSGRMSVLVDGSFYAGENGGFWSLYSGNNYNNRRGMYADSSGNLQIGTSSTENVLRTAYGYVQVGPMNSSHAHIYTCLLYTSPSPRDQRGSGMPGYG